MGLLLSTRSRFRRKIQHAYTSIMVFAVVSVAPTAYGLASPRNMPPLSSPPADRHLIISATTSDYGVRKNHPTSYDEDPPFKGPLSLLPTSSPDVHRRRVRRHYLDDANDLILPTTSIMSQRQGCQLKVSSSTDAILKAIVDRLAYKDAPVDAKEVAESVEFYLRTGKRLIGAARRIAKSGNGSGSGVDREQQGGRRQEGRRPSITVYDLCSGHGLTGMLFAACNPPRSTSSSIPVRTVLVDRFEPQSHAVLKDCIAEVCPWIGDGTTGTDATRFVSSTLEDFFAQHTNKEDGTNNNNSDASVVISTHACGSLTDQVLEYAVQYQSAAIAVMPCCYTGTDKGAPYGVRRALGVSMSADVRRSFFLQDTGAYHVDFATIPKTITPMNRIIVAERRK